MTDDEAQKLLIAEPYLPYSQSLALGLATLWFIYLCGEIVRPFFTVLAWSLALAVASYPLSSWLQERIFNRSLASFLALIAATLVIFAPTLWIVRILMTTAAENVVGLLQQSGVKFWLDPSTAPPRLVPLLTVREGVDAGAGARRRQVFFFEEGGQLRQRRDQLLGDGGQCLGIGSLIH